MHPFPSAVPGHALRPVLALPLVLALTACATLSESDCARSDWFAIGSRDARHGYTPERLNRHRQACAKYGYEVDPQGYHAGYQEGLAIYCVPARSFDLGRNNSGYAYQCPAELEATLRPAHDLGRDVYAVELELAELEREIQSLRSEIDDEKAAVADRDVAEQRLRYVKNDRDRRERERDRLLERARQRGYGEVW